METKLTLRMDSQVIRRTKEWAAQKGISLSRLTERFFEAITQKDEHPRDSLHPGVKRLIGPKTQLSAFSDQELRALRVAALLEKHR